MAKRFLKETARWHVEVFSGGSPMWVRIKDKSSSTNPCDWPEMSIHPEDARDLAYCLDRVIGFVTAQGE